MLLPYSNMQMKHWNPGATEPLILPIHVICNTDDETIYEQVKQNSRTIPRSRWIDVMEAHDGIAVICGSGPSLKDHVKEITRRSYSGSSLFALNGAALFLYRQNMIPTYQVILDSREETGQLVGPAEYWLFASQVHPSLFEKCPDAYLWQLDVGNWDLIDDEGVTETYAVIGGSASVGNTALCLAYTMGYRTLHLYGYDSCHRNGKGHAFPQPMNDGDPTCLVTFDGKEYLTSLTMKLQAERFLHTAETLKSMGCEIHVHGDGLLPAMYRAPKKALEETEKYVRMWQEERYRDVSPGEAAVGQFFDIVQPIGGAVIDFGCGTGRAGLAISARGMSVRLVDFANNSLDVEALDLPFTQHDLTKPFAPHFHEKWGFCCDVMEHIPTKDVERVIRNIMDCANECFFQISTVPDQMGALIGETLHLTVRPHEWWYAMFDNLDFKIAWEQKRPISSVFHVKQEIINGY